MTAATLLAAVAGLERDEAREDAQRELSKGVYRANEPSLAERVLDRVFEEVNDLLARAAEVAPGGQVGLVLLVILLALLVAVVLLRTGPLARRGAVFSGGQTRRVLTAVDHRREADRLAAEGRWAEAVRERMRAIVRELEARGVLEVRPGRTANEVASEAGAAVPALLGDLRAAARSFDEIWYGGRTATAAAEAQLREVDQRVRSAHLAVARTGAPSEGAAVPQ